MVKIMEIEVMRFVKYEKIEYKCVWNWNKVYM